VAQFLFITEHILAVPAIINNHKKKDVTKDTRQCMSQKRCKWFHAPTKNKLIPDSTTWQIPAKINSMKRNFSQ